jgi:hypothetical protein
MSIQLSALVMELEKRVEALERSVTASPRRYGVLYAQARAKKAQGAALQAEVAAVMKAHPGQKAYTIRSYLSRDPLPSVRTVQGHMQAIRAQSSTSR